MQSSQRSSSRSSTEKPTSHKHHSSRRSASSTGGSHHSSSSSPAQQAPQEVTGTFFPAASGLRFSERSDFTKVEGDYEEDESSSSDDDRREPQRGERPPPRRDSSTQPPTHAPGTTVNGAFFASAHDFAFEGKANFRSVKGNMKKIKRRDSRPGNNFEMASPLQDYRSPPPSFHHSERPPNAAYPIRQERKGPYIEGDFFADAHNGSFNGKHEFTRIEGDMVQYQRDSSKVHKYPAQSAYSLYHGSSHNGGESIGRPHGYDAIGMSSNSSGYHTSRNHSIPGAAAGSSYTPTSTSYLTHSNGSQASYNHNTRGHAMSHRGPSASGNYPPPSRSHTLPIYTPPANSSGNTSYPYDPYRY